MPPGTSILEPVCFRFLLVLCLQHIFLAGSGPITADQLTLARLKRDVTFPGKIEANQTVFGTMLRKALASTMNDGNAVLKRTKWCGPGSRAANFTDLGDEAETDKCCRTHDHCPESIPGHRWKHGLHNSSPYTRSHCYCDDAFRRCLEDVNSKIGNLVAEIYFNLLKVKCYKQDCPIVRCLKYTGMRGQRTCQDYKVDCNRRRIWQFYDPKKFEV